MSSRYSHLNGFTLIELSIVLAIIAVIAGGVMAGNSLLKAATIRSVSTDVTKYRQAVSNFQEQYGDLPGDIPNAFSFFDSDCGTDAAAPIGCNGNDNGSIDGADEGFRAWQHLALAEMIDDNVTGEQGSGCIQGLNVPTAPIGTAAGFGFVRNSGALYLATSPSYKTLLVMGANDSNLCTNAAVTIDEAYQVDLKMDDGNPTTGETVAIGDASCLTGGDFSFGQEGNVCAMGFTLN